MAVNHGGRAKVDANQAAIVKAMRHAGIRVQHLHTVGKGVPDLLCGYRGVNVLIELKNGLRECDRKLTQDEQVWHECWTGQVDVASTIEEAILKVIEYAKRMGRS